MRPRFSRVCLGRGLPLAQVQLCQATASAGRSSRRPGQLKGAHLFQVLGTEATAQTSSQICCQALNSYASLTGLNGLPRGLPTCPSTVPLYGQKLGNQLKNATESPDAISSRSSQLSGIYRRFYTGTNK